MGLAQGSRVGIMKRLIQGVLVPRSITSRMDSKIGHKMETGLIQGAILGDMRTRVLPILKLATV